MSMCNDVQEYFYIHELIIINELSAVHKLPLFLKIWF